MFVRTIAACLLILGCATPALAQKTIFLVRHAERADAGGNATMAADPDLSDAGRARAASLATVLADAGVTAIFTTELKRTQQTAAPLGKASGVIPTTVKATDTASLIAQITASKGNVLVVGHSNTVPAIVKALGVTTPVAIGDNQFDHLFLVTATPSPSVLTLHYR